MPGATAREQPATSRPWRPRWRLTSSHRSTGEPAYLGSGDSFDRAIVEFANVYAEQNERDYQALSDAVKSGRMKATTGL
jgi:hypothetical protein